MPTLSPSRRDLLLVLSTALLARLFVQIVASAVHDLGYFLPTDDSYEYLRLTESLLVGSFSQEGVTEVLRTPGYPLFVALGAVTGHPIGLTVLLQVTVGAVGAVLVYQLAQHVAKSIGCRDSRRIALFAGLLYALDPLSVVYTSFLLSETLFTTLLIAHLLVLSKHFTTASMRHLALSGLLMATSAFVRPVVQYWPFVVVGILLFLPAPNQHDRPFPRLVPALVFLLAAFVPLLLWSARNAYQTDYFGFTSVGDYNLYVGIASSIEGIHRDTAKQRVDILAEQNGWTAADRYGYMRREGIRLILSRPVKYIAVHTKAILQALSPAFSMYASIYLPHYGSDSTLERLFGETTPRFRDFLPALPMYLLVGVAWAGQYVLALAGVRRVLPAPNGVTLLLLASAVYFLVMAGAVGDYSTARYRHSAMPALCVLAGFGASSGIARVWPRKSGYSGI